MTDHNKISATSRTEFGKGAARRTRRAGLIPAVLYGHGTAPVHVSLPAHDVQLALRVANALLTITVDGGKELLALPKQIQRDPIKDTIDHVDLVIVRRGEKVTVEVPVVLTGDDRTDLLFLLESQTITLEVEATSIPADITVDVAALEASETITAGDLSLPDGAAFVGEPETVIVVASVPRSALAETGEAAEGEAAEDVAAEA